MIGMRAISGSVAMRLRNLTIAASESRRSASMFTSSRLAPPRTWSSATCTAPLKSPDSMRRRNRCEPVMLVRSPMVTNPLSGVISNGSSPLKRVCGAGSGSSRGARSAMTALICLMCSGVVPQQPPAALRNPLSANSRSRRLVMFGFSS